MGPDSGRYNATTQTSRDLSLILIVQASITSLQGQSENTFSIYVPQGSILGPILFNIFINDIPKINSLPETTTSTTIYADDVQLLCSGSPNNLELLKICAETNLNTMKE